MLSNPFEKAPRFYVGLGMRLHVGKKRKTYPIADFEKAFVPLGLELTLPKV